MEDKESVQQLESLMLSMKRRMEGGQYGVAVCSTARDREDCGRQREHAAAGVSDVVDKEKDGMRSVWCSCVFYSLGTGEGLADKAFVCSLDP